MSRRFQVELEPTNISSGPEKTRELRMAQAIVTESGIAVLKPLTGDFFVIRIIEGDIRFVAPARVSEIKKHRTKLVWINLLDDDREDLAELLNVAADQTAHAA